MIVDTLIVDDTQTVIVDVTPGQTPGVARIYIYNQLPKLKKT